MIIIADCGGTKGDWAIADGGVCLRRVRTGGINPFHQQPADIRHQLEVLGASCHDLFSVADVLEVYFYGAGCNAVGSGVMERLLAEALSGYGATLRLHVASDLLGAARALCGRAEGIACILGTGSNSCLYDGTRIIDNTPPLGYILGDEGSGGRPGQAFPARSTQGAVSHTAARCLLRCLSHLLQSAHSADIPAVTGQPLSGHHRSLCTSPCWPAVCG